MTRKKYIHMVLECSAADEPKNNLELLRGIVDGISVYNNGRVPQDKCSIVNFRLTDSINNLTGNDLNPTSIKVENNDTNE